MRVLLEETRSGGLIEGLISEAHKTVLPIKRDGWNFNWRSLSKVEGVFIYKVSTIDHSNRIEGLVMLSLLNSEMLFMNNVEVAPHNYGKEGHFENIAGCLLAFECYQSFQLGRGPYTGYVSFDSKTELIDLYQTKYGATHAMGHKMFFEPTAGKTLIRKFLFG